jgi:hypothetical protein
MLTRLLLAAVSIVLIAPMTAGATPITFDFAGTLNAAINGTTQFTGSATINGDPTVSNWGTVSGELTNALVSESGGDVSITLNVGGQTVNFANNPQNPYTQATFQAWSVLQGIANPTGEPMVESLWYGAIQSGNPQATFAMSFYDFSANGVSTLSNLRNLNLPLSTGSVFFTATPGGQAEGTITSIALVSTPEPSTLAIFAVLGIAAIAHRSRRNR